MLFGFKTLIFHTFFYFLTSAIMYSSSGIEIIFVLLQVKIDEKYELSVSLIHWN
jgi:hypothetical protein